MTDYVVRMKPYIQPFERAVALEELATLAGSQPQQLQQDRTYAVSSPRDITWVASRLAYWERVDLGEHSLITAQSRLETSGTIARNGVESRDLVSLALADDVTLPQRRMLRYGPHGIHEYRGKFFPQLVRAFVNAMGVGPGGVVADPMVGSGTTAVEVAAMGIDALALDMNPLSVLIASTKCRLLNANGQDLVDGFDEARQRLMHAPNRSRTPYFDSLEETDQAYLTRWLPAATLESLDAIAWYADNLRNSPFRDLMRVSLSNIIRRVSWQKDDDLRIRRDEASADREATVEIFVEELRRSVRAVTAYLAQRRSQLVGTASVREGDARLLVQMWSAHESSVDLVITSPPYATALPYLDTDRLSLCYLGLLTRTDHRKRDLLMIGNREITDTQRSRLLSTYDAAKDLLPLDVTTLVDRVRTLNENATVGFRRRNAAALLSNYFLDMRAVLRGIGFLLRPGARAVVVVGSNHTVAGGVRIEIETARLIGAVAQGVGLDFERLIPMEMLVSRDIFRRNASSAESIVVLRRKP